MTNTFSTMAHGQNSPNPQVSSPAAMWSNTSHSVMENYSVNPTNFFNDRTSPSVGSYSSNFASNSKAIGSMTKHKTPKESFLGAAAASLVDLDKMFKPPPAKSVDPHPTNPFLPTYQNVPTPSSPTAGSPAYSVSPQSIHSTQTNTLLSSPILSGQITPTLYPTSPTFRPPPTIPPPPLPPSYYGTSPPMSPTFQAPSFSPTFQTPNFPQNLPTQSSKPNTNPFL